MDDAGIKVQELAFGGGAHATPVESRLGSVETDVQNLKHHIEHDVKTSIADVANRLEKRYDKTERMVERRFLQMMALMVTCIVSFMCALSVVLVRVI
jgi:cyclopropane fatty-acyl-phospholipid synthase-like methyltransferase